MKQFENEWINATMGQSDCITAFSYMHWILPKYDSKFIKSSNVVKAEKSLNSVSLSCTFPKDDQSSFTVRFLEVTGLINSKSLSSWVAANIKARTPKFGTMYYWVADPNGTIDYFCKCNNILPITLASKEVERVALEYDMIEFEIEFYCSSFTHTEKDKRVCEKQMAKYRKQYPEQFEYNDIF